MQNCFKQNNTKPKINIASRIELLKRKFKINSQHAPRAKQLLPPNSLNTNLSQRNSHNNYIIMIMIIIITIIITTTTTTIFTATL